LLNKFNLFSENIDPKSNKKILLSHPKDGIKKLKEISG
jgi:membrane-associated HD superfamily phosphohydrolase